MNKLLLFLVMGFAGFSAIAQKTTIVNDPNAKVRAINGTFTKVSVSSGIELFITQGNEESLAVSVSDARYESRVRTEVKDGVLHIVFDNNGTTWTNDKKRKIKAYLSCRSLEGISGSAGASVLIDNEFSSTSMSLHFSSGARFTGKLQTRDLSAEVSSGGEIQMTGVAVSAALNASSGSSLNGFGLTAATCTAKASSGAAIKIAVQKELSASASSGGEVRYKGGATIIKRNVSSGGSVKQTT